MNPRGFTLICSFALYGINFEFSACRFLGTWGDGTAEFDTGEMDIVSMNSLTPGSWGQSRITIGTRTIDFFNRELVFAAMEQRDLGRLWLLRPWGRKRCRGLSWTRGTPNSSTLETWKLSSDIQTPKNLDLLARGIGDSSSSRLRWFRWLGVAITNLWQFLQAPIIVT